MSECPLCGSPARREDGFQLLVCTGCCEMLRPDELVAHATRRTRRAYCAANFNDPDYYWKEWPTPSPASPKEDRMIIEPNTTNQIKLKDVDGVELWFDVIGDETVVTTTFEDGQHGPTASLTRDDLRALVRHLVAQDALSPADLEVL